MSTTFQRNLLSTEYNGWENYETWNVALWINNDEGLYHLAAECGDYETLVNRLYDEYGVKETKDGVKFADPKVNVVQINSDVFDFQSSLTLSPYKFMLVTNTETRPFFVQQAKSGRWNVWVYQYETEDGYKYTVKQTLKDPDDAYSWGLNYINHVIRY